MVLIVFPRQSAGADDSDGQGCQCGDRGGAAVVADGQAAESQQPGDGAFHDPAVSTEAFAGVHAEPGDPCGDPASALVAADPAIVVGLVRVQLDRSAARSSPVSALDRGQPVQDGLYEHGVMAVGSSDCHRQWQPIGGDQQVVLRPQLAPIRGVWPRQVAPPFSLGR